MLTTNQINIDRTFMIYSWDIWIVEPRQNVGKTPSMGFHQSYLIWIWLDAFGSFGVSENGNLTWTHGDFNYFCDWVWIPPIFVPLLAGKMMINQWIWGLTKILRQNHIEIKHSPLHWERMLKWILTWNHLWDTKLHLLRQKWNIRTPMKTVDGWIKRKTSRQIEASPVFSL